MATVPVTVAFLDLPAVAAAQTADASWTTAATARLLPDRFTLLGFVGDQLVVNVTGAAVPAELAVGPDPSTPAAQQLRAQGGDLQIPAALAWLTDFDAAVTAGMGFRIPLTNPIRGGLDRLVALGLRVRSTPATAQAELEGLIARQSGSRAGYRLLRQGTPTNNTGTARSGHGAVDEAEESFAAAVDGPPDPVAPADWSAKTDGQCLAELLGIKPDTTAALVGADGTDIREARAMNTALWPATWGYHLQTMLNPIFDSAAVDATRSFFTRYVSGRGPLPTVQVGRQPYGLLVTTAFSRLGWADGDPDAAHRRRLHAVLSTMAGDWQELASDVAFLGRDGDPHQLLLDLLAAHPGSVEFYQRYAQSAEDYFNRLNLGGIGADVVTALDTLNVRQRVRTLLTHLGYDPQGPDPDASTRLFTGRQHALHGPLVDDLPLSERRPGRGVRRREPELPRLARALRSDRLRRRPSRSRVRRRHADRPALPAAAPRRAARLRRRRAAPVGGRARRRRGVDHRRAPRSRTRAPLSPADPRWPSPAGARTASGRGVCGTRLSTHHRRPTCTPGSAASSPSTRTRRSKTGTHQRSSAKTAVADLALLRNHEMSYTHANLSPSSPRRYRRLVLTRMVRSGQRTMSRASYRTAGRRPAVRGVSARRRPR